ncbi:winged helix-turn-helix transcriptional regulator [Aggregicoccus sp. 17bor-14]|uniref:ArsR/SmtB family transcription factor n=1 Tax=Myxococcaceae TaxID=31 RepID=UPI00129C40DD|nr:MULTISPECIES: metalloregulator ArsR/SmtB family transcription factor [Myxococcaceae]MBF5044655.1 winged helix-turn-helix transcriptional regulator [Simulacricoccus sp. 17bor-14]MRI90399.1 winged helix-turn-helix transcriptional regulator [Aggregicoccus sp. 17bor-14]
MSARSRSGELLARRLRAHAPVFAALGDETRLALVGKLSAGPSLSISQLAAGAAVTRQAITKHLRVLEEVGLVEAARHGRESLYALRPEALAGARRSLDALSQQWADALGRLKAFVED